MRETFAASMETTQLSGRRGVFITRATLIIVCGLIFFSLLAVGLISYNVASCSGPEALTKTNGDLVAHCPPSNGVHPDFVTAAITTGDAATASDMPSSALSPTADEEPSADAAGGKFDARLPRSVVPVSYDIRLVPFLIVDNFTFNGEVSIVVNVVENCNNITLHAAAITVHDVKLNAIGAVDTSVSVLRHHMDAARQFLVIETGSELMAGAQYRLYIKYEGVLNEYLQGFYRSSYRIGNETR